jgi:hypothetical protein
VHLSYSFGVVFLVSEGNPAGSDRVGLWRLQHDDEDRTLDGYRNEIIPAMRDRKTLSSGYARHR